MKSRNEKKKKMSQSSNEDIRDSHSLTAGSDKDPVQLCAIKWRHIRAPTEYKSLVYYSSVSFASL